LLAFSRKQMLVPKVFDLNDVVRDTERMLGPVIGEDVRLVTALHAASGRIAADQGQLEQVLLNLAVNARDAMPGGGTLSIETSDIVVRDGDAWTGEGVRPGRYAVLTLSDTGIGMSDEVKRHVFEPFFTTKGPGKGTGLGLAVVHGFVKQSQGHIVLDSSPGRGTTFRIYLPNVDQPLAVRPPASDVSPTPRGTETILLVEDEEGVRALGRRILQAHGYTVIEAGDGASALRAAKAHRGTVSLLVTDVVMPGLNGRALAEQLVALRPSLKVLYVSGYTDDAVVRYGIQQDDTNFLAKPFTPDGLASKVRSVLDR
jgi:CheY-like chemotaxis protein